jgi:DNA-binding IclR family transcriptional regulator
MAIQIDQAGGRTAKAQSAQSDRSQSVDRAIEVLIALGRRGPMRLSEIINDLDLPRRNVGRLLSSLEAAGLLRRDPASLEYDLGFTLAWLGNVAGERLDLARLAKPVIQGLMAETHSTALLHLRQSDALVAALVCTPQDRLSVSFPTAQRIPLSRGVGRLVLAHLPAEARRRLLYRAGERVDTGYLDNLKEQGYLVSHGEVVEGVHAVGAPIFDPSGDVVAVVAIASMSDITEHAIKVVSAAEQITCMLTTG